MPGAKLPPLVKGPVTRQHLDEGCAAGNDFYPLHGDKRVAARMGLPGTPAQGYLQALLALLLKRWVDGSGVLGRLSAPHRRRELEGDRRIARARVRALEAGRQGAKVWVEDSRGEANTLGVALVVLAA